jgi:phosphinothricin acetyltransferase
MQFESTTGILIRDARATDVEAITEIQNALITTAAIEWTDVMHDVDERAQWLMSQRSAGHPVVVAVLGDCVVAWASYGEFRDSKRWPGYRLTVENTIHVREEHWGSGVGRLLMDALVERARNAGLHAMIAAVDGENVASVRFHERLGFREVARMPQVGTKFGRWLDLVLLERLLDDSALPPG